MNINIATLLRSQRLSLALLLIYSGSVLAAPISFNGALPVSQGERIVRGLVTLADSDSSNPENIERQQLSLVSVLGYGITAKWSVFGVVPIRHLNMTTNERVLSDTALGDIEVFSRYELFRADQRGTTTRIAPFAGVRLPTGELGLSSDDTTDVFAGLIVTSANIRQNFDLQLRYDRNGSNQEFNAGDSVGVDFSWQKRIHPKEISVATRGFWFSALEANLNYTRRDSLAGQSNNNSGGFTASLTRRWIAEFAVRIPIIKNLNGNALEPNYTVFTGIRANF